MTDPFDGSWRIDLESGQCKTWDHKKQEYIPDPVGSEDITIRVRDGVQDYEVLYGKNPTIRMGYTSRYDDTVWAPYTVRGIEGVPEEERAQKAEEFRRRTMSPYAFNIGKPIGLVRTVYVDERTHYRVSKSVETGAAEYIMLRRMAEDHQSYLITLLDVDGRILFVRRFVRV